MKSYLLHFFTFLFAFLFTLFSAVLLLYISIATMIGPLIAPTIIIVAGLGLRLFKVQNRSFELCLALMQTSASVGGSIATAIGFTLPTLYFLSPSSHILMLSHKTSFCLLLFCLCSIAGFVGMLLAYWSKEQLLNELALPFPVGHMTFSTIQAQMKTQQGLQLLWGALTGSCITLLRDASMLFDRPSLVPKEFFLWRFWQGSVVSISVSPMLWSIGFTTGTSIIFPLLYGIGAQIFLLPYFNNHSLYLPFSLFAPLKTETFSAAFCSGLVLTELLEWRKYLFSITPHLILSYIADFPRHLFSLKEHMEKLFGKQFSGRRHLSFILYIALGISPFLLFWTYQVGWHITLTLLIGTMLVSYNASIVAGKIGLVQFGRYVTFVMLPMLAVFQLAPVQITLVCVFVAITIATCSNYLFCLKVGLLAHIHEKLITLYHVLGILVTGICIGAAFIALTSCFELGSAQLFAQRGQSRALLIMSTDFNGYVLLGGFFCGILLKKGGLSPAMVLGGILAPPSLSLGLIGGAAFRLFTKTPSHWFAYSSGLLVSESTWILAHMLVRSISGM